MTVSIQKLSDSNAGGGDIETGGIEFQSKNYPIQTASPGMGYSRQSLFQSKNYPIQTVVDVVWNYLKGFVSIQKLSDSNPHDHESGDGDFYVSIQKLSDSNIVDKKTGGVKNEFQSKNYPIQTGTGKTAIAQLLFVSIQKLSDSNDTDDVDVIFVY